MCIGMALRVCTCIYVFVLRAHVSVVMCACLYCMYIFVRLQNVFYMTLVGRREKNQVERSRRKKKVKWDVYFPNEAGRGRETRFYGVYRMYLTSSYS